MIIVRNQKKATFKEFAGNVWSAGCSTAGTASTLMEVLEETSLAGIPIAQAQQVAGQAYKDKKILEVARDKLLFMRELEEELEEYGLTLDQLKNSG